MKPEPEQLRDRIVALQEQRNEFIAKLIHDIRGPLTSIVGFSELLDEGMLEGDSAADAIKIIRSNAARLTQMTTDLLAMNRAEPENVELNKAPMDLSRLVSETTGTTVTPGVSMIGDERYLKSAFEHLMNNAKKFSRNGTPPRVSVRSDGERAIVTIEDSGIGIPPDEVASIGERFYRASNAKKEKLAGTGVGVFVAKSFVEAHGGELRFASDGKGTTVTVVLPCGARG